MNTYDYYIHENGKVIAQGFFKSTLTPKEAMTFDDMKSKAKRLCETFWEGKPVCCAIYLADDTSGDLFDDIRRIFVSPEYDF